MMRGAMSNEAPPAPAITPAQPVTPPDATPAPAQAAAPVSENTPPAITPAPPAVTDNRPATEATPAETPPPPAIGPDGKLGENWFLTLGDEFAPHAKDLGKHKDLRSIITELDYFRKNGVEYPAEGSASQAVERWNKVAGVPETPEGYGLNAETMKLPEGMEFDSELADAISKAAHATGTPPAALQSIAGAFNDLLAKRTAEVHADHAAGQKAAQDALVAEWRGDYQSNASTVRHLADKLAEQAGIMPDDPSIPAMVNNPAFARMIFQVAKLTSEDRIAIPSGFGDLKSPAQRIAEIKAGTDPVWGAKWVSGSKDEKTAAYAYVKALSEKARQ